MKTPFDECQEAFFEIIHVHFRNMDNRSELCIRKIEDMEDFWKYIGIVLLALLSLISCEVLDNDPEKHVQDEGDCLDVTLDEVAHLLSVISINTAQLNEVHNAVTSSSGNGYDEEYTMKNLFSSPGAGVGDCSDTKGTVVTGTPLKELISEYVRSSVEVKSGEVPGWVEAGADKYLEALENSDIQIYWPYSEMWDGVQAPVITYDPGYDTAMNIGYEVSIGDDGSRIIREVEVDEEMAKVRPVWVVNRNEDAGYLSLEMLRREDPDWGNGGGTIVVKPLSSESATKSPGSLKTLVLKDFIMHRQYDGWLAGAAEFFVKLGSIENFTASTEAEMLIYNPTITDFMIVVKRNQMGVPQPFNAVLVSEWTDQLTHCALMITEDDGGTMTKWDCSAVVKVNSKSYGFDISIPFNKRDDIVWRGQLASRWIESNSNVSGRFGDVSLTFEILEN